MKTQFERMPVPDWVKIISETEEDVIFEAHSQRLKLLRLYGIFFIREWPIWEKSYLPPFSLAGRTVLDVGAGCGETAFFYFLHGADKVVAIEPSIKAVDCLRENTTTNKWNVQIIPEYFKLGHLKISHDFMKMDIDGGEIELLNVQIDEPCVVEVHNDPMKAEFEKKGFRKVCFVEDSVYVMSKNF